MVQVGMEKRNGETGGRVLVGQDLVQLSGLHLEPTEAMSFKINSTASGLGWELNFILSCVARED